jgi:hypothetical protein
MCQNNKPKLLRSWLWQWNMTAKLGFQHETKKWQLFTDSSKMNLRASSLCIENKNPSVVLLHAFSNYWAIMYSLCGAGVWKISELLLLFILCHLKWGEIPKSSPFWCTQWRGYRWTELDSHSSTVFLWNCNEFSGRYCFEDSSPSTR